VGVQKRHFEGDFSGVGVPLSVFMYLAIRRRLLGS